MRSHLSRLLTSIRDTILYQLTCCCWESKCTTPPCYLRFAFAALITNWPSEHALFPGKIDAINNAAWKTTLPKNSHARNARTLGCQFNFRGRDGAIESPAGGDENSHRRGRKLMRQMKVSLKGAGGGARRGVMPCRLGDLSSWFCRYTGSASA